VAEWIADATIRLSRSSAQAEGCSLKLHEVARTAADAGGHLESVLSSLTAVSLIVRSIGPSPMGNPRLDPEAGPRSSWNSIEGTVNLPLTAAAPGNEPQPLRVESDHCGRSPVVSRVDGDLPQVLIVTRRVYWFESSRRSFYQHKRHAIVLSGSLIPQFTHMITNVIDQLWVMSSHVAQARARELCGHAGKRAPVELPLVREEQVAGDRPASRPQADG
jgi:hypothetical protein